MSQEEKGEEEEEICKKNKPIFGTIGSLDVICSFTARKEKSIQLFKKAESINSNFTWHCKDNKLNITALKVAK